MRRKSILDRLCVKILLDHERYLKHDGVVEFPQVEAGELLYLLKSVDKSVSVDKELPRGLGDVEVILKETLDGEKSLVVKALDGASLEHLSEEHIAQSGGQLIDEACNAEIVIADDGLLGVEYLADLKGYLSLFEGAGKILYSLDGGAYADKHMSVKLGAQRIRDGACELLKILRLDIIFNFLNYCNVMLVDVDNEVLGLVGEEILHGVDLTIRPGSVTALVGPSGSGKSTIAKLIAGFWDVSGGSILLGGQELKNIPQRQLAGMIAYVTQDNYLFDETIRENIRMGRRGATDADVENVARAAGCHDFIMGLEHGYDTVVGGAGGHLSGGERQRIAIARAMLKDAPIVILDEATAYLDPENEAGVQSAIGRLVAGKTLIVIAHRLSTVTNSDQIVVVKDGRIEASGTHEELLACSKLYQQMWNAHIGAKDGE